MKDFTKDGLYTTDLDKHLIDNSKDFAEWLENNEDFKKEVRDAFNKKYGDLFKQYEEYKKNNYLSGDGVKSEVDLRSFETYKLSKEEDNTNRFYKNKL